MKFEKKNILSIVVIYIVLNIISYALFHYYSATYKKVEAIIYLPEIAGKVDPTEFFEENFKLNFGNLQQLALNCYKLSLIDSDAQKSVINFGNIEAAQNYIGATLKKGLAPYNLTGVDISSLTFSDVLCKFRVDSPFSFRFRALVFVFLFNIFHAILLFEGFVLIRHKYKNN